MNNGRRTFSEAEREHLVRLYDGNLAFADREFGRLRATLERLGLWERTVVIVTADHGEALYEHGHIGHIEQLYEQSIHVPLIIRLPRTSGVSGVRVGALVSLLDVAPTIADLFGVLGKGGSAEQFQGTSLLPAIFGAAGRPWVSVRSSHDKSRYAIRDDRFKYIYNTSSGIEELYDLQADPDERRSLAAADPLGCAFYRQRLFAWILDERRGEAAVGKGAELTAEQIENLKALGYLK